MASPTVPGVAAKSDRISTLWFCQLCRCQPSLQSASSRFPPSWRMASRLLLKAMTTRKPLCLTSSRSQQQQLLLNECLGVQTLICTSRSAPDFQQFLGSNLASISSPFDTCTHSAHVDSIDQCQMTCPGPRSPSVCSCCFALTCIFLRENMLIILYMRYVQIASVWLSVIRCFATLPFLQHTQYAACTAYSNAVV